MPTGDYMRTPEYRETMRVAMTGQVFSAERRAKISARLKGKPKSEAHRAALSAAHLGMKKPWVGDRCRTHMLTGSRTYRTWRAMRERCLNPDYHHFHLYGGRGITICERWLVFENFLADMGIRPDGRTIDRINNDGNYEPGNCRWATPKEQAANRRKPVAA